MLAYYPVAQDVTHWELDKNDVPEQEVQFYAVTPLQVVQVELHNWHSNPTELAKVFNGQLDYS